MSVAEVSELTRWYVAGVAASVQSATRLEIERRIVDHLLHHEEGARLAHAGQ